jgi:hypothetical protein
VRSTHIAAIMARLDRPIQQRETFEMIRGAAGYWMLAFRGA